MSNDYKKNKESFIIVEQIITLLRLVDIINPLSF